MKKLILISTFILLSFCAFSQNFKLVENEYLYQYCVEEMKFHWDKKYVPFKRIFKNLEPIRELQIEGENVFDEFYNITQNDQYSMTQVEDDIIHACVAGIIYAKQVIEDGLLFSSYKNYTLLIYQDENEVLYMICIRFNLDSFLKKT